MIIQYLQITSACRAGLCILRTYRKAFCDHLGDQWLEPVEAEFVFFHDLLRNEQHVISKVRREHGRHMKSLPVFRRDLKNFLADTFCERYQYLVGVVVLALDKERY